MMFRVLIGCLMLWISAPTLAETVAQVPAGAIAASAASPDGRILVAISFDDKGRPNYAITRDGKTVVDKSRLGFLFTDAGEMLRGFKLIDASTSRANSTWSQPWGEWSTIRDNHVEFRVRLAETANLKREMEVVFRLFDDGVGFRYAIPKQSNLNRANIAEELTQFAVPPTGAMAWWKPSFESKREEYLYQRTALGAVGTAATPITIKLGDGTHLAIHEAALVDYSGMSLRKNGDGALQAVLAPSPTGAKVSRDAPFVTPWRTIIIADDAPGLYMSHIMLNLNEPSKLADTSWIHPGKYNGVWWKMIKGEWGYAPGPDHGATTEHAKRYIDFAAANGLRGTLIEGWNVGWSKDWFGNGHSFLWDTPTPDYDDKAVAAYAKSKGVRLIGHNETAGAISRYESMLDRAFGYASGLGMEVIKTGYVSDAGQLERAGPGGETLREWHEGQWMVNHFQRTVEAAAKYHLSLNIHEPVKDTGLRRTWPNLVSREGARGMEYQSWADKNPPEHEATMVFTRMLEGPMDYTPGILSLKGQNDSDIPSTLAKQLANYVVIYSPIVMAADTLENYAKYPGPLQFIQDVPTDWSDTRVLNGVVGEYVTIARKAKGSNDWYLGAVGDATAREVPVALDFLDAGRSYTAEIYRDGPDADYRTAGRHSIAIERRTVRKGDRLNLALAPGGGQAIRFASGGGTRRR